MSTCENSRISVNKRNCLIRNRLGLHARAAAKFVKIANLYEADVWVEIEGNRVSGISILGLMMLAAGPGSEITIETKGIDSEKSLDALIQLVEDKFDED